MFAELTSWFHREKEEVTDYLRINVGKSYFLVSHTHNVATEDLSYAFPEDLEGQSLFGLGKVRSVEGTQSTGMFAPKTKTNNYFVYLNDSSEKVLAHCFAEVRNPERFELPVALIESVWDFFGESE